MHRKVLAATAIALSVALAGCSGGSESQGAPPPPEVTVATPLSGEIVDWDDYVGRFEAPENVEVKPRVSGYLVGTHFRDGQYVRRGQLLFTIDSRPAQAQLDQARAQLARAQAQAVNARTELARSRTLAAQSAASVEEVEQRQAALRSANADVAAAAAAHSRARSSMSASPASSRRFPDRFPSGCVDPGNAVTADQTVLTTVVSTNPLHFAFDGSEALLLRYQRQSGAQDRRAGPHPASGRSAICPCRPARLRRQCAERRLGHDPRPGGRRPIPTASSRPGMMGRLRLASSPPYRALLVPDTAIVTDAARRVRLCRRPRRER